MGFKYAYKTDEELELSYKLLAPGECRFMVKNVADKDERGFDLVNSKNNPYLKIELIVIDKNGDKGLVAENISSNAAWKIKDLFKALGVAHLYNQGGEFEPSEILGLQGKGVLEHREYQKRDGTMATTNSMASYVAKASPVVVETAPVAQLDDSIPF